MRSVYKIGWLLILLPLFVLQPQYLNAGQGQEYSKTIKKEFSIATDGMVNLSNRYGKMDVKTWDQGRVKIEVTITVRAGSESDAQKVFDRIEVDFSNSNDYVEATTVIEDKGSKWWGGDEKSDFNIDFEVYLPRSVDLELSNKYGNVYVAEMDGDAKIAIKYGNLRMEGLNADLDLSLAYGNGTIGSVKDVQAEVAYCKANFAKVRDAEFDSKYSNITLEKAGDVRTNTKYDSYEVKDISAFQNEGRYDNIRITKVESLSASSRYSDFKVQEITDMADLDMQYGAVAIEEIARGFSEIRLVGKYTDFKLGVANGANYQLEATADYAGVLYPEQMSVTYEKDKGAYHEVEGYMGQRNARSVIKARLDYGGLKVD